MLSKSGIISSSCHQLGVSTTHPSTPPTVHTPVLRVLPENGFLHLPSTHQLAHGRASPHQAPAPVRAPGEILPHHPPIAEGYMLGSWQDCCLVRLCGTFFSTPGPPPPSVLTLGRGMGFCVVPSGALAQLLYLFFQSSGGCQGPLVDFSHFGKLGFSQSASSLPMGFCLALGGWPELPLVTCPLFASGSFQGGHYIPL